MPAGLPRPLKRMSGRTTASDTPTHVRSDGVRLTDDDREYVRRKLGMHLGKFAWAIERVSVRVQDVNGPKGGVDLICRTRVVLSGLPSVVIEQRELSTRASIDGAIERAERAVREVIFRSRTLRARPSGARARRRATPMHI